MLHNYEPKPNLFYFSNPIIILSLAASWIFLALLFNHPLYIITIFIFINLTLVMSGNYKTFLSQLKYALPFVTIIILINTLFNHNGTTLLFAFNLFNLAINIYLESLFYGLIAGVKLLSIITAFTFYTLVINPDEVLYLTRKLGNQISLIINMSMRLFPLIWTDYSRIQEIQKHRSPTKKNDNVVERVKGTVPTLSILLVNSLDRSLKTAESLYSRGYGSGEYTTYNKLTWYFTDYLLSANIILIISFALWIQLIGGGIYNYYPSLSSFILINYQATIILGMLLLFPVLLNWSCKLWLELE